MRPPVRGASGHCAEGPLRIETMKPPGDSVLSHCEGSKGSGLARLGHAVGHPEARTGRSRAGRGVPIQALGNVWALKPACPDADLVVVDGTEHSLVEELAAGGGDATNRLVVDQRVRKKVDKRRLTPE